MKQKERWNQEKYQKFISFLEAEQDLAYQKFHQSLVPEQTNIIGIRMPRIREIAKEINQTDRTSFLSHMQHNYYEETMIHGFLLGYEKDFERLLEELEAFLPYNDNWAINDSVSNRLKQFKKNRAQGLPWIYQLIHSKKPWNIRFGYTLLLSHYVNEDYIDIILKECNRKPYDAYYVKMAVAWLLSVCYIKFPEKTEAFFKNNRLDDWTHNKAIQKTCESKRVTKETKQYLKTLKRST